MCLLNLLSIEWNSIRLGGPPHGIVTETVHKTLPGWRGLGGGEPRGPSRTIWTCQHEMLGYGCLPILDSDELSYIKMIYNNQFMVE